MNNNDAFDLCTAFYMALNNMNGYSLLKKELPNSGFYQLDLPSPSKASIKEILEKHKRNTRETLRFCLDHIKDSTVGNWNSCFNSASEAILELKESDPTQLDLKELKEKEKPLASLLKERVTQTFNDNSWTRLNEIERLDIQLKRLGLTRKDITSKNTLPQILQAWDNHDFGAFEDQGYCRSFRYDAHNILQSSEEETVY